MLITTVCPACEHPQQRFVLTIHSTTLETRNSLLMRLRGHRDEEAWSEFASLYQPVIYSMARRRGLQDADAREIVQEVLLRVSSAIERFEPQGQGSFRGWLSTITRNETVGRLRRLATGREVIDGSGVRRRLDEATVSEGALMDEFTHDHRQHLFRVAAAEIRKRTSEVNWNLFWMTAVEGKPVGQVAAEFQLDPAAVYVARCRIIKRIRQFVTDHLSY